MTFNPKALTAAITLALAATAGAQVERERTGELPPAAEAQRAAQPSTPQVKAEKADQAPNRAQVLVRQTAPDVTVRQGDPQIIVRQAPPAVTIEQAQPEIIVRMPEPDVDVTAARPEVDVRMPEPAVQVERSQQQAEVAVNAGEPQVQFERTGEPRMIYKQAEGKPQVRYERQGEADADAAQARSEQGGQQSAAADQGRLTRERLGIGKPLGLNLAKGDARGVPVKDLEGMEVRNGRDEKLGTVNGVFSTASDDRYVLISHGGFLGMFEKEVALPAARVRLEDDHLLVNGVTEDDLNNMGNFHQREVDANRLGGDDEVRMVVAQR